MIVATWRADSYYTADAQKVYNEIVEIGEYATPQEIVEKAKGETTELHKCFEWDNDIAAEKYRIVQARKIVQSLVFKRTEKQIQENKPEIRVIHKPVGAIGYKPLEFIVQKQDEYERLLEAARRELHAFKVKYQHLSELDEIMELINW